MLNHRLVPYYGSMAIDTDRVVLDLREALPGVVLLEALDAEGRLTSDPVVAVEGIAIFSFPDGSTRMVAFDRSRPL